MKIKKVLLAILALLISAPLFAAEGGEGSLTHKMLLLALQVGIIIFAAKMGGMFAQLLKLPSVLGELGIGILIGPYALGGIGFGQGIFAHGIIPPALDAAGKIASIPITPELYGLCTIASIILLFLSGIETDFKMFIKYAFAGSLVGVGGVVASFILGDFITVFLLPKFMPQSFGYLTELANGNLSSAILDPAALFMGIMSTATSVGITARILSEKKQMDSAEGVTIMAGAVIDDVLGIIVLAIGMGVISSNKSGAASKGVDWVNILKIAAQAFGVWLGGTMLGLAVAKYLSRLLKLLKSESAIATMALGLALIIAGIFESMGLSMIIGAYVMGLSLSRTDIKHLIQETLDPIYTFLVPIFFCVMGMLVDCSQLCSKPILIFGSIYTIAAIIAKVVGCAVPSLLAGFNLKGSFRIGAGMIPRGEVALIIAGIGLSQGFLTQDVFGIGIMMTLITTVVAPPALVGLFAVPGRGTRKVQANSDESRKVPFKLQSTATAKLMLDRLVVTLRKEGFFAYLLNPREHIWVFSKESSEISVMRTGSTLYFECTPKDETFIATAITEVSSELTSLANDLARPIKNGQINQIVQDASNGKKISWKFAKNFVVVPHFKADSSEDAIKKLVKALKQSGKVQNEEAIIKAIETREHSMPTGLNYGVAIPHGRTDAVDGIVGIVATVDDFNGIPGYETMDNSPVRIIFLTVSSESYSNHHLQLLSEISNNLRDPAIRQKLLNCQTAEDMLKFLSK